MFKSEFTQHLPAFIVIVMLALGVGFVAEKQISRVIPDNITALMGGTTQEQNDHCL